ncbi:hypothetical protein G7K_4498-t1 [Saitoella complicata NRRL Y-17804]|uniref:Protein disulfide-isomerase n=1 Tax=Saitoella complicata (strain BCRC 22490 / CBS 7301 / JCM 7358 / NBRC 10748 / NRRL Y-17804) TaxID=698492 RepID=A0A0E9NL23_SAICN|nr:hypothetical protein G7K_4498-t1 [Saitoella complicata NRRL Y-17804]
MRFITSIASILLASSAIAAASDVLQLGKANFDKTVAESPLVLAEFFAPWCGHCKALAPEYEIAATQLKEKGIAIAKIDCTEEQQLCQEHGIQGYPTLKVFRGLDSVSPYQGARKADAIVSYMVKQSLPAVSELTSSNFEDFTTSDNVVVVAFFDAKDTESNSTFSAVANKQRDDFLFGATTDKKLAKKAGVKVPGVAVYKKFDDGLDVYGGEFDAKAIEHFARAAAIPLIGEIGPETYQSYIQSGIPLAYVFYDTDEAKEELKEALMTAAKEHKGKVSIAMIDARLFGGHANNLNLQQEWPAFAIQDTVKNLKYPLDQSEGSKVSAESITSFLKDYASGALKPSIKSEPVPETQEPVHVIVGSTFEEVVYDDERDVLVEYYAPWCGHCKNLAPKWEQLAELYTTPAHSARVRVAKIDATANDVPVDLQGFPTIRLYPAGNKDEPVEYQGDRSIESFVDFIRDKGTHHVDGHNPLSGEDEDMSIDENLAAAVSSSSIAQMAAAATEGASATETVVDKAAVTEAAEAAVESATKGEEKKESFLKKAAHVVGEMLMDDELADVHDEL